MALNFSTSPMLDPESFNKGLELLQEQLIEKISIEISKVKTSALTDIKHDIEILSNQLSALQRDLNEVKTKLNSMSMQSKESLMDKNSPLKSVGQKVSSVTPPKKTPSRRFYAKYSPTQNVLVELPDNVANRAAFVAEVSGEDGTVSYNKECTAYALSSLSGTIYPFFDYELKSDSPTIIESQNIVKIHHVSGKNWQMDGRISLIIK